MIYNESKHHQNESIIWADSLLSLVIWWKSIYVSNRVKPIDSESFFTPKCICGTVAVDKKTQLHHQMKDFLWWTPLNISVMLRIFRCAIKKPFQCDGGKKTNQMKQIFNSEFTERIISINFSFDASIFSNKRFHLDKRHLPEGTAPKTKAFLYSGRTFNV